MDNEISRLRTHIIVCGVGTTGRHIVRELIATGAKFIAIDTNEERLEELAEEIGQRVLYVVGDATDDHILERAGIEHAGVEHRGSNRGQVD